MNQLKLTSTGMWKAVSNLNERLMIVSFPDIIQPDEQGSDQAKTKNQDEEVGVERKREVGQPRKDEVEDQDQLEPLVAFAFEDLPQTDHKKGGQRLRPVAFLH